VIVADTHAWLWWFADPSRLSEKATVVTKDGRIRDANVVETIW